MISGGKMPFFIYMTKIRTRGRLCPILFIFLHPTSLFILYCITVWSAAPSDHTLRRPWPRFEPRTHHTSSLVWLSSYTWTGPPAEGTVSGLTAPPVRPGGWGGEPAGGGGGDGLPWAAEGGGHAPPAAGLPLAGHPPWSWGWSKIWTNVKYIYCIYIY